MFPKFHGIALAANSWITNATLENLSADPTPLGAGRLWFNTTEKALKFSSLDAGGALSIETVATGAEVADAVAELAALGTRVDAIEAAYVKKDGSVAFTGDINAGNHKVTNLANAVADTDAAPLGQVKGLIANLGNAFVYQTTVDGGESEEEAFDLDTLTTKTPGSYYKVATSGWFVLGAGDAFQANAKDGLVFNTEDGVDKIDNTDSTVAGTAGEIDVDGSTDTGYTVSLSEAFKTTVSDNTDAIAAEVARATAAEGDLADDIAAEASRATTAEGVLDGKITTEKNRAEAAEGALSTKIGDLSTLSTTDKTSVVASINEVVSSAAGAGAKIGDLTTLTTDAKSTVVAALNEVDANADAAQAAADSAAADAAAAQSAAEAAQSTADAAAAAVVTEKGRAEGVEAGLASDIAAETARAQGVEGSLAALSTTVKTSLQAAINEVDANADAAAAAVVTEKARAEGIEAGLRTDVDAAAAAIAAEEARAKGVEGDLTSLSTTAKGSLVAAINELADAAGEGADALKTAINGGRFTYLASSAALVHTVTHGLNSNFVQAQVLVKGDDDKFRNDIVSVEETSANVLTITLTEARIIKVAGQALDQLA